LKPKRREKAIKRVLPHFLLQWPLHRKQARTEEFWPGSTVHRSFERLQAIDLSFGLTIAPRLSDRISDGFDVSLRRVRAKRCIAHRPDFWASLSQAPSLLTLDGETDENGILVG
jgi:hypothetical protein